MNNYKKIWDLHLKKTKLSPKIMMVGKNGLARPREKKLVLEPFSGQKKYVPF